ncbi:hypothetical protein MLD38_029592 [Melastoma candidum]|uniref:Uncharacterized protein n=1 Tax=Melastoma candidum TaxID=119954 RepID=A0ACB9N4K8_9MYRT|nr:hypothetical protein MLD38_029592 [Melastoma candidum]
MAEDAQVSGYLVPSNTRVMINVWAIGRDPNSWADVKGSNFEHLPFGSGRRSFTLEYAVANLLHCFNWELPDGMKPADMEMDDVFGFTVARTTRLIAVPSPRLPQALY